MPDGGSHLHESQHHPLFADSTFIAEPGTVDVLEDSLDTTEEHVVPVEETERLQLRAAVGDYFTRYPYAEVQSVYRIREGLEDRTISPERFIRDFHSLVVQYEEIVALTVQHFPDDRALQALPFEALRAVSYAQLHRIEHEWHMRFKDRPDAYLIAPVYGRALVLAEGIRGYEEAAEYEGIRIPTDEEADRDDIAFAAK